MVEEAIALSGANDEDRKVFTIGLNCDADSGFNRDPKDPNKYEQEGQKVVFDSNQMCDYYLKVIREHPLVTYVEDAFSQFDFVAHNKFKDALAKEFPQVNMSLKQLFSQGHFERFKDVTTFVVLTDEQKEEIRKRIEEKERVQSAQKNAKPADKKGAKPDGKKAEAVAVDISTPAAFPETDPD